MVNRLIPLRRLVLTLVLGGTIMVLNPGAAFAQQAQTLGDMTNSVYDSLISLQFFLSFLSYILGTFFTITGLQMLRSHVDDPGRNPLNVPLLRLAAAALFLFAPTAASAIVRALGSDGIGDTGGLLNTKDFVTVGANTFDGGGVEDALGRFVVDFAGPFLENLLPIFAYIAGLIFLFIGLKRMALASENGPQGPGGLGTMGTFLVSAMLMAFGYVMYALQGSLFGTDTLFTNELFDTGGALDESINNTLWAVFIFLRIVGYISVLRGLFMLRGVAEGANVSIMAVSTHLIAGSMLANSGAFVTAIENTFLNN